MAATVGASLSGVTFPQRHAGLGPFISSAGNVYFFGRDSANVGQVEPHKASDPMSAFTAQTLKTMSSAAIGTAIEAMACYQVGQVIHIATQISTGQVFYNFYTMDVDAWGLATSETGAAAASFAPSGSTTFVDLVVRSSGEVVIIYCAGLTAMSSGFNMVRYTRRTATNTYSSPVNVDNGGSVSWGYGLAALGASDRVHFFIDSATNADAHQRTLSAANVLQTFPAAFEASLGAMPHWDKAVVYTDAGTTKVRVPFVSTVNREMIAMMDSADSPTVTTEAVSNVTLYYGSGVFQASLTLVNDGMTLHFLYADNTTQDLWHDTSTGGGGAWGTDVEEIDAATINYITSNVYTRSGTKYLAMIVDDGGTIKYVEITLPWSLIYDPNRLYSRILAVR